MRELEGVEPSKALPPKASEAAGRQSPATILVADDDEDLRRALCAVLSCQGYDVIELGDGAAALELLAAAADGKRPRPDLLLLDFCMPELSGIGLLRVLRRFGSLPPAILITAFPDPAVEILAHNAGAVRVLRKPFDEQVVLDAVQALLRGGDGAPEGVSHPSGS